MDTYAESRSTGAWAIAGGIILIVTGIAAILAPFAAASVMALLLPIILLIKGIAELVSAFRARTAGSVVWRIVVGIVSLLAAAALFARPALAGVTLATILIAFLIVDGIVRIAAGLSSRVDGRWMVVLAGVVSIVLGALLWVSPFQETMILIGIYIGIDLLFAGMALIAAGTAERHRPYGVAA